MNSKYGLIIFVLVIIANMISGIMKKRAEQQKLAKLSSSKPRRTAQPTQSFRSTQTSSSQRTINAADRAEQLAARRKAQLDELRSRRKHRAGAKQQHPQARIGPGSTTTQPTPSSFRSTAPQRSQPPAPVSPQRVVIRPSTKPKQEPVSHSSLSSHSEHIRADTQRLHGLRTQLGEPTKRIAKETSRISPTSAILDTGELTPELLRRMVVLKEIFDKPVAMRDSEIWDRL